MAAGEDVEVFLAKARESLAGARSEASNRRYNNSANRCYYACFQAAVAALLREGISPSGAQWEHRFVQSQFAGQLINRRKLFPAAFGDVCTGLFEIRRVADYRGTNVGATVANRALRRATGFVEAVQARGGAQW